MARYFRFPFANRGDKTALPDDSQTDGRVSYNQGYGPDYQRTPGLDPQARRLERDRFNQLMFDVTSTLQLYYQEAYPNFITPALNGGNAFMYPQYARVRYDAGSGDRVYESLVNNNAALPTVTANWRIVDFAGMDARYLLESNNLSDLVNTTTARTNLGLGTAATRNTGTAVGNVPLIGTPGTSSPNNNSAVVVRSGSNSNGFFRVHSDGFIEQWGSATASTTARLTSLFTLPTPYVSINYFVYCSDNNGAPVGSINNSISLQGAQPTTGSQFRFSGNTSGDFFYWLAIGF